MANEMGHWGTPPAATFGLFGGDSIANISSNIFVATAGQTLTKVRAYGRMGSAGTIAIGLYTVSGGLPVTLVASYTALAVGTSDALIESGTISQALTNGTSYCLALGTASAVATLSVDALTSGMDSTGSNLPGTWSSASIGYTLNSQFYLAGDVTTSSSSVPLGILTTFHGTAFSSANRRS